MVCFDLGYGEVEDDDDGLKPRLLRIKAETQPLIGL